MKERVVFAIPGDIEQATGGYGYDRRMIREFRAAGWSVDVLTLPGGFPDPSAAELEETAHALAGLEAASLVLVDGLAFGAMPGIAEREAERLRLVALVHHPLAWETGTPPARAQSLRDEERRALRTARRVIATSGATAELLATEFGVPRALLRVAPPGTEPGATAPGNGRPPVILAVGSLAPRKGQDVLVEALAHLSDLEWRCRIVGNTSRDAAFAERVRSSIEEKGLAGRVELTGEVADPRAEMSRADLFALPTRYEGYGMVFAEAMAHGLPVVGCAVGAVGDVVPKEAGLLVRADDPIAFADALRALLGDPARRREMARAASRAAEDLPAWSGSADTILQALREARA